MGKSSRWILGLFGVKKPPNPPTVSFLDGDRKDPSLKRGTKEKRRWSFGGKKATSPSNCELDDMSLVESNDYILGKQKCGMMEMKQETQKGKHAIAVAVASAAAAEAALAAASAAATVVRLTANGLSWNVNMDRELAAIKIQTAFRGHLARRALRALKAVVRLQALFRGHRVRKKAALTLQCMQALVKVQARGRAHAHACAITSARSHTGSIQKEAHTLRLQHLPQRQRNQQSRPTTTSLDEGNGKSGRKEKMQAVRIEKKQAVAPIEPKLSNSPGWSWIEKWMVGRSPVPHYRKAGKTAAIGMERSSEESSKTDHRLKSGLRSKHRMGSSTADAFSFDLSTSNTLNSNPLIHTSPSPLNVESFRSTDRSPANRVLALKQRPNSISHLMSPFASTPSMRCRSRSSMGRLYRPTKNRSLEQEDYDSSSSADSSLAFSRSARHTGFFGSSMDQKENVLHFPNYMTSTKSTEAKVRSQSAPKQRPAGPEKLLHASSTGRRRLSPSWEDKLYYSTKGSEQKSQFQRSASQVRARNKVSAASELMDNWSLRDDSQYW